MRMISRRTRVLAAGAAAGVMILAVSWLPGGPARGTIWAVTGAHHAGAPAAQRGPSRPGAAPGVVKVSRGCGGVEVVEAEAPPRRVYAAWMGCGGIGFARSTDGGLHFSRPVTVPGSAGFTWDPSMAVAPDGTLYVGFMRQVGPFRLPVVATSLNHGKSFARVVQVRPKVRNNWGDRDFLAAGRHGQVYLTWDYGPSAGKVVELCSLGGSCAFSNGDVNTVIQKSTTRGKSFGPIIPVGPNFPRNGGISARVVVMPNGRVDVLSWGHFVGKPPAYKIFPGHEVFASSANGTSWPRHPRTLWPGKGSIAVPVWWIDGAMAADAGGTLYVTWDTQSANGTDTGWLTWSADGGKSWSRPVAVTHDHSKALHLLEVAGGARGRAYIGWQTNASGGYATWVRAYSTRKGWLGRAVKVSPALGSDSWPGDTIGIAALPGTGKVSITWGSAIGGSSPAIWARVVTLPKRPGRP